MQARSASPDIALVTPAEHPLGRRDLFREEYIGSEAQNFGRARLTPIFRRQSRENLGAGLLAAQLRRHGFDVSVINASTDGLDHEQTIAAIGRPPLVGLSLIYDLHLYNALRIIRTLRAGGYCGHITMGGTFATLAYEHLLAAISGLDSIVLGEGILTIVDLARAVRDGGDWRQFAGIAWRGEHDIVKGARRELADLSRLPFAARDSLQSLKQRNVPVSTAAVFSSFGCLANCTFCSAPVLGQGLGKARWRARPAAAVVDEMDQVAGDLGVGYFYFCDDNFIGYGPEARPRLMEMAARLRERRLGVNFRAEIRADSCHDVELLETLRAAGLTDVLLGVESGSRSMLNRLAKGTPVETNARALETTRSLGFHIEPSMILVDAYTTVAEFRESVQFIERLGIHECGSPLHLFNRLLVFPGTRVEKQMVADGLLAAPDPWHLPEDLTSDQGLHQFCQRVCIRPYTIRDPVVRAAWQELAQESNEIFALAAQWIPSLLERERLRLEAAVEKDEHARTRERYLQLLGTVRQWRDGLGGLTLALLRTTAEWCADAEGAQGRVDGKPLGEALAAQAADYNNRLRLAAA